MAKRTVITKETRSPLFVGSTKDRNERIDIMVQGTIRFIVKYRGLRLIRRYNVTSGYTPAGYVSWFRRIGASIISHSPFGEKSSRLADVSGELTSRWSAVYVQEPNFTWHICSSKGKWLTSILHWESNVAGACHLQWPSLFTTIEVVMRLYKMSISSSRLALGEKKEFTFNYSPFLPLSFWSPS